MNTIPKIIHQIWSEKKMPLPDLYRRLGETWKMLHPDWQFILWNDKSMSDFMHNYYPQYYKQFESFPLDIQRWDSIRYLILYQMGGVYIDSDYECIKNITPLLQGECCFAMEPPTHIPLDDKRAFFNNAFMGTVPKNLFFENIIEAIFGENIPTPPSEKDWVPLYVSETTGPYKFISLYHKYERKSDIYLIPAECISPFSKMEIEALCNDKPLPDGEIRLQKAYAIHYFAGTWMKK